MQRVMCKAVWSQRQDGRSQSSAPASTVLFTHKHSSNRTGLLHSLPRHHPYYSKHHIRTGYPQHRVISPSNHIQTGQKQTPISSHPLLATLLAADFSKLLQSKRAASYTCTCALSTPMATDPPTSLHPLLRLHHHIQLPYCHISARSLPCPHTPAHALCRRAPDVPYDLTYAMRS